MAITVMGVTILIFDTFVPQRTHFFHFENITLSLLNMRVILDELPKKKFVIKHGN